MSIRKVKMATAILILFNMVGIWICLAFDAQSKVTYYTLSHNNYSYIIMPYRRVPHLFIHFLVPVFKNSQLKMQFRWKSLSAFLAQNYLYIGIDTYHKKEENCHFWGAPYFLTTWPTVATTLYPIREKSWSGELNCGAILTFSEIANATIGFSAKFSIFYVLEPLSES